MWLSPLCINIAKILLKTFLTVHTFILMYLRLLVFVVVAMYWRCYRESLLEDWWIVFLYFLLRGLGVYVWVSIWARMVFLYVLFKIFLYFDCLFRFTNIIFINDIFYSIFFLSPIQVFDTIPTQLLKLLTIHLILKIPQIFARIHLIQFPIMLSPIYIFIILDKFL